MAHMQTQAAHLGAAELSRSADLVNAALTEMTGATSPRLHLELLMARLLLPALDDSAAGIGARLDRLEREGVRGGGGAVAAGGVPAAARPVAPAPVAPAPVRLAPVAPAPVVPAPVAEPDAPVGPASPVASAAPVAQDEVPVAVPPHDELGAPDDPGVPDPAPDEAWPEVASPSAADPSPVDASPVEPERVGTAPAGAAQADAAPVVPPAVAHDVAHDVPTAAPVAPVERPAAAAGGGDTEVLRRRWPEVLDTLGRLKKTTWVLISQNAQVVELDATTLTLGFAAPGLASAFRAGSHADLVQQAVRETLGFSVKVEPVLSGPAPAGATHPAAPAQGASPTAPARTGAPSAAEAAASWDAPVVRSAAAEPGSARPDRGAPDGSADADERAGDDDPDGASPSPDRERAGTGAADGRGGDPRGGDSRPAGTRSAGAVAADPAPSLRPVAAPRVDDVPGEADAPALAPVVPLRGATPTPAPAGASNGSTTASASGPGPASGSVEPGPPPPWDPHPDDPGAPEPPDDDWAPEPPRGADRVRAAARAAASAGPAATAPARSAWADDEPSMDDPDISSTGLSGVPLLTQMLSATVIDEQVDEGY
jgi:DNA polymerase-3 subunit gamma/tau